MTLQEILDAISMRYPHAFTDAQIISMVDDIQKRIFRTLYRPTTTTTYDLIAGNPFYPIAFSPENIIDVVVDGEEYPYQNIKYDAQERYYYIEDGNTIGLYPTPTEDVTDGLTVFHSMDPTTLSASNLTASPDLDSAFHMLLVYHTCRELAAIARDDRERVFIAEIDRIEKQFNQARKAKPHQILDVYGVGWRI